MPSGVIKGSDSEKVWERAVAAADDQYGKGLKSSDPDKFYAIVMTIYKSMCTKHNCTPKNESVRMSGLLGRIEEESAPKIKVPGSASAWQLYSDTDAPEAKKRLRHAVRDLDNGLRSAAKDVWSVMSGMHDYDERTLSKAIGKAFNKYLSPVMSKYNDTGATDTDPKYVGSQSLIDFVKNYYGIRGWTDLGDDV